LVSLSLMSGVGWSDKERRRLVSNIRSDDFFIFYFLFLILRISF